ncbi:MAG TPA: UPF0158 family protein [Candidatus Kapabacteria bacterium]|nr:UPF0158 family protein [Candidatus Kapabacteria bacterium]HPO62994.1 UPF0158 family protein [Candidatus Kapabacteria bacterium]
MKFTKKQINDIADGLTSGLKYFINLDTLEYQYVPDNSEYNAEFWDKETDKIIKGWKNFTTIEQMDSKRSYRVMENFIDEIIEDKRFQEELHRILSNRKPFANFRAVVESSEYREKWFRYRDEQNVNYVKYILESNEIEFE